MGKVLLVAPLTKNSKGGMAVWTETYLRYVEDIGRECDLLNIATIGVRAIKGKSSRVLKDEIQRTRNIFRDLRRLLSSVDYEIAHVNTSCSRFGLIRDYLIVSYIKNKQRNCKCILHFHCDIQTQCRTRWRVFCLKQMLKKANKAFVLNKKNYHYLNSLCAVSCCAVPNFIERSDVRNEDKEIRAKMEEAIFVGYIQPTKGISEIFELAEHFPTVNFRLVGEVHDEVRTWSKPDNVFFLGPTNHGDIKCLLDKSDVFVFLSYSEGFSLALLESMARGLPVLATDVGANKEMIENHGGIVVPAKDVKAAVEALTMLSDFETRKEMSVWNIEKVKSNYTVSAVMQTFKTLYDAVDL